MQLGFAVVGNLAWRRGSWISIGSVTWISFCEVKLIRNGSAGAWMKVLSLVMVSGIYREIDPPPYPHLLATRCGIFFERGF